MRAQYPHNNPKTNLNLETINLETIDEVSKTVMSFLTKPEEEARSLIDKTSKSAYRKIHDVVSSALEEVEKRGDLSAAKIALIRSMIFVKYQLARQQISSGIASYVEQVLRQVHDCLLENTSSGKIESKCAEIARNGKTILDSLAVLVQQYSR